MDVSLPMSQVISCLEAKHVYAEFPPYEDGHENTNYGQSSDKNDTSHSGDTSDQDGEDESAYDAVLRHVWDTECEYWYRFSYEV